MKESSFNNFLSDGNLLTTEAINVLSLFDGLSAGQIALNQCGIKYDNYFASEIDKYAISVTQDNYPNTKQLGNVLDINYDELPKIDLLIGGSPCQGFSLAGKQLNFDDERSKLFFEFVKAKNKLNPKYFLLENVNMRQEWQDIISEYLGVKPIKLNSGETTAQNRIRLYWTNIPLTEIEGFNLILEDILEDEVDDKYIIKGDVIYSELDWKLNKNGICNPLKNASNKGWHFEQNVYTTESKTRSLKAGGGSGNIPKVFFGDGYGVNDVIRKLTPLECERLQTIPDNYTKCVSNSQRYKMLGNSWCIDTICEIFKGMSERWKEKIIKTELEAPTLFNELN